MGVFKSKHCTSMGAFSRDSVSVDPLTGISLDAAPSSGYIRRDIDLPSLREVTHNSVRVCHRYVCPPFQLAVAVRGLL